MDERNSIHDKNRLNDKCEVQQRILQNSHRPQSAYTTYLTNEDRENPRVKHSAFRDIKDGNSQIRKQYGTDESLLPRPQVGNSNFSFQGVRYDRNCDGQLQFPLINSASHCGVPFVQTLPYLATNAYMRNQTMLFESSAHAQKEIKPEVIHQTVDMTAYKLPPFMPVFSGMLNRRRRREHRPRRQRTTFSTEQTIKLEIEYGRAEYISRSRRYELAESLNLTENQIKIWFQNRRAKEKRIEKAHLDQNIRQISFNQYFHQEYPVPTCTEMCQQCNLSTVKMCHKKS